MHTSVGEAGRGRHQEVLGWISFSVAEVLERYSWCCRVIVTDLYQTLKEVLHSHAIKQRSDPEPNSCKFVRSFAP